MPELPEVETIVRSLRPHIVGHTITGVAIRFPDVLRTPAAELTREIDGRRVESVDRRGKNVVVRLSESGVLALNLGMTGRLLAFPEPPAGFHIPIHATVTFELHGGTLLVFDDVRRFGTVEWLTEADWADRAGRMGPEPFDRRFTARALSSRLGRSRAPIRSWLLDQKRIAGIGNIYANEALYLAGIDPRRPAHGIIPDEARRLHRALRRVLREAIRAGGTTLRDYRTAEGKEGRYGPSLAVYGRAGAPCIRCGTRVERTVFSGRSAFFCPKCQPTEPTTQKEPGGERHG
ncbi:MAG: DNA-formamidopyrimidine glycosylase [Gemmatimonadota bacterium]|nr:DNA-formamidopyrimidine glycosylase [Gemmatimonadota bacterium]